MGNSEGSRSISGDSPENRKEVGAAKEDSASDVREELPISDVGGDCLGETRGKLVLDKTPWLTFEMGETQEPPLVKGGQGRTSAEIWRDASFFAWVCIGLAVVVFGAAAWCVLFGESR